VAHLVYQRQPERINILCTGGLSYALFISHQNLKNQKDMLTLYYNYTDRFTGILVETNRMGCYVTDPEEQIKSLKC
jgi:hypothetical protein